MALVRSPYTTPMHQDSGKDIPDEPHMTIFRHPGYPDTHNTILALPALDSPQGGLHHETARIACAIIANNRWDGYLSESKEGDRVMTPTDGVLLSKEYYFCVPDESNYPIVHFFSQWTFPHRNLPAVWQDLAIPNKPHDRELLRQGSNLKEILLARDITCRLTDSVEGTRSTHLIPRSEISWFKQNGMLQYAGCQPEIDAIDSPRNAILLRSDIRTVFMQYRFAIIPKPSSSDDEVKYILAIHVFSPGWSMQFAKLYHRVALQSLCGVSTEYIFASFAWTVFSHAAPFLTDLLWNPK